MSDFVFDIFFDFDFLVLDIFAGLDDSDAFDLFDILDETVIESFNEFYGSIINRIPEYLMASYLGITPVALSRIKAKNRENSEKST